MGEKDGCRIWMPNERKVVVNRDVLFKIEVFFYVLMYLLAIGKKNNLQANVMLYYIVVVGCSYSDVTSGALQVEGPASF
jgi:hypothetical protein